MESKYTIPEPIPYGPDSDPVPITDQTKLDQIQKSLDQVLRILERGEANEVKN